LILEQVFPEPGKSVAFDSEHLAVLYPKVEGLRFNFVIANGINLDTSSDNSTNKLDRELLKFIRSQSDLIITTGKTARAENLAASKFAPMLILTTSSEDLDVAAVHANEGKTVYITQRLGTQYQSEKATAIGIVQDQLPEFVDSFCRANSFKHSVLECGMETAKIFAPSGNITEVDLTLTNFASKLDAEAAAKDFLVKIGFEANLLQILRSEDTWFFRFGAV
jgi:DNA-binding LacI/PurR family transcriptional regulator